MKNVRSLEVAPTSGGELEPLQRYAVESEQSRYTDEPVWAVYYVRTDGTRNLMERYTTEKQALYMQSHWTDVLRERERYQSDPAYRQERDAEAAEQPCNGGITSLERSA